MKKTIFIGISLLAISICVDEVCGREPIRRNSSSAVMTARRTSSYPYPQKQEANTQVLIPGNNGRPRDVLSSIVLEEKVLTQLKNIINSVPSKNIRALKKNIGDLYDKLPKNSDKDVQTAVGIMNRALSCLEELLDIRSNLYFELFNESEKRENLSDSVEPAGIIESLNRVDMEKLVRVISICEKECEIEKSLIAFTENLKKFSNRIKESKKILEEMLSKLSPIILSQIEGSVGLKNLETTNTLQNQNLGERRDSGFFEEQQPNIEQIAGTSKLNLTTEGNLGNTTPQPTPEYQQNTGYIHILPEPFVEEPEDVGQIGDEGNSNTVPQQPVAGSDSNSTISQPSLGTGNQSPQSTPAQSGQQPVAGSDSNNTISQPNSETGNQPPQLTSGQQPGTESSAGNTAISQATPVQQNAGQTGNENDSNSVVSQIPSGQQSGTENNPGGSVSSPTPAQSGQQPVAGSDSNNTISQPNSGTENQSSQSTPGQQPGTEGNAGNTTIPQATSVQQPVTKGNAGNAAVPQTIPGQQSVTEGNTAISQATPAHQNAGQTGDGSNLNAVSPISATQQNVGQSVTASSSEVNIINKESPEKFYALLETNIKLLKDEDLRDEKKKAAYDKVCKYLEEAKNSQRSFEQRVSDVLHIINTYNSLATLVPKTKEGKRLSTVPRQKIKSLREVIYSEVFDDMKLRMEKLKSDDRFKKFTADFDEFIKNNDDNKTYFEKSTSGRDKRKYMSASAKSYDGLIEKIWEELNVNYETVDRVGYTLVKVINSIDVN